MKSIILDIKEELNRNGGKLSEGFIEKEVSRGSVSYHKLTPSMRVCVIRLRSGHEVLGVAQVLNPLNDIEAVGKRVAYDNAINEVWKTLGAIAKAVM